MGSLVCRVELHKKNGIIITVENSDYGIFQTMVLDGTTITTTNEGDDNTSVITQAPDSITIQCKDFMIDAETITCTSSEGTLHKSGDTFEIVSSNDLSLDSDAKVEAKAASDMKLSARGIDADASTGDFAISGNNVKTTAKLKAGVESKMLALEGTVSAKMEGGLVDVKGKKATLEGSAVTTIGGAVIKVG